MVRWYYWLIIIPVCLFSLLVVVAFISGIIDGVTGNYSTVCPASLKYESIARGDTFSKIGDSIIYSADVGDITERVEEFRLIINQSPVGDIYQRIYYLQDYNSMPLYAVWHEGGNYSILLGTKEISKRYQEVKSLQTIAGNIVYGAKENGEWYVYVNESRMGPYDSIGSVVEVNGTHAYAFKKGRKLAIVHGEDQLETQAGYKLNENPEMYGASGVSLIEVDGNLVYKVYKNDKEYILFNDQLLGEKYEDIYEMNLIRGELAYRARLGETIVLVVGDDEYSFPNENVFILDNLGASSGYIYTRNHDSQCYQIYSLDDLELVWSDCQTTFTQISGVRAMQIDGHEIFVIKYEDPGSFSGITPRHEILIGSRSYGPFRGVGSIKFIDEDLFAQVNCINSDRGWTDSEIIKLKT